MIESNSKIANSITIIHWILVKKLHLMYLPLWYSSFFNFPRKILPERFFALFIYQLRNLVIRVPDKILCWQQNNPLTVFFSQSLEHAVRIDCFLYLCLLSSSISSSSVFCHSHSLLPHQPVSLPRSHFCLFPFHRLLLLSLSPLSLSFSVSLHTSTPRWFRTTLNTIVLSHLLACMLGQSFIHLLALLACSLTHSLTPELVGKNFFLRNVHVDFKQFQRIVRHRPWLKVSWVLTISFLRGDGICDIYPHWESHHTVGQNQVVLRHIIIHFSTREWVSKRAN